MGGMPLESLDAPRICSNRRSVKELPLLGSGESGFGIGLRMM
jgi:hypothetical protein